MLSGTRNIILTPKILMPKDVKGNVLSLIANEANNGLPPSSVPSTSPTTWKDLTRYGNNATMVNQAGSSSSGWKSEVINGKTVYYNRLDGVDDYGSFVNTASLDITTNEFAIAKTFRIQTGATTKWIWNKSEDAENETQYGLKYNATNGYIELWLEGYIRATIFAGSITANVWYNVIFYRNSSGVIRSWLNTLEHSGNIYVGALTSRPNLRLGARSSNAEGTTHTDYAKEDEGTINVYSDTSLDINRIIKAETNAAKIYSLDTSTWSIPTETSTDLFRLYFSTSGAKTLTASVNSGHGMSYVDKSGEQVSNSYSRTVDAKDYVIARATEPSKIIDIDWNSKGLTGSLSSSLLSKMTNIYLFYLHVNKITGKIPSLSNNTKLQYIQFWDNKLTGNIPDISTNTILRVIRVYSNNLTGFEGGTVSSTLGDFQAQNNLLTQTAVDAILSAFVAAGRTSANGTCNLELGGTGNATPSATGLADKATLVSRGWTVTTN